LTKLVLDASVAAKWFVPADSEPLTEEALHLYELWDVDAIRFVVPDLFWAEIGAVLLKAVRRGLISSATAQEAIPKLRAAQLPTIRCRQLITEAFPIALHHGRSVYDSLYVALAVHLQADLVTADERLANALAARFPVKWLGAFSIG
jgi:predicted nucleic acid-binding protein